MLVGDFERVGIKNDLGRAISNKNISYIRALLGKKFIEDLSEAKKDLENLVEDCEEILSKTSVNALKMIVEERLDIADIVMLNTNTGCLLATLFFKSNAYDELKAVNSARGILLGEICLNGISQTFGTCFLKCLDVKYSRMNLSDLEEHFSSSY